MASTGMINTYVAGMQRRIISWGIVLMMLIILQANIASAFDFLSTQSTWLRGGGDANSRRGAGTYGTLCIYQGTKVSCATRKENPGRLQRCSREMDDGVCMNFPDSAAVFTCTTNNKVNFYDTPGCAASEAAELDVGCVDMTVGTYFLLCCTEEEPNGHVGSCEKAQRKVLGRNEENPSSKEGLHSTDHRVTERAEQVLDGSMRRPKEPEEINTNSNFDGTALMVE